MSTSIGAQSFATPRRARLARYGLWQLRDYFMNRGSLTFALCVALGYGQVFPMTQTIDYRVNSMTATALARYGGSRDAAKAALRHEAVQGFVTSFTGVIVFIGALLAIHGIAAGDRKSGSYRFLFAKPLSPFRFYAQEFLVHLAGFIVVFTALGLLFGTLVAPVLSVKLLLAAALMFFFYASIGFVFSAATPADWLPLIAVSLLSQLIWDNYADSPRALAKLRYLLPPLTRTGEFYGTFLTGSEVPWHLTWWFAGYGAACFALGLWVLRRRRLAVS